MRRRISINPSCGTLDDVTLYPYRWDDEDLILTDDGAWNAYLLAINQLDRMAEDIMINTKSEPMTAKEQEIFTACQKIFDDNRAGLGFDLGRMDILKDDALTYANSFNAKCDGCGLPVSDPYDHVNTYGPRFECLDQKNQSHTPSECKDPSGTCGLCRELTGDSW